MFNAEADSINIKIDMVLYRYNAKTVYHEKSRHSDCFVYYVKGGHSFDFADFSLNTEAGNLLYLPYMESYRNELTDKRTEYFQIDFFIYENGKPVRLFEKARIFSSESAEKTLPLIKRIYDTYTDEKNSSKLFCISDIIRIIAIVKNEEITSKEEKSGIDKIRNTVSHINEFYYLDTPVSELAAMSNMCVSNLEKLFKKNFGLSPVSYRNKIRTEHAKKFISGGYSITDTTQMTGFSDYFYFARIFKKFAGCSPGNFKDEGMGI